MRKRFSRLSFIIVVALLVLPSKPAISAISANVSNLPKIFTECNPDLKRSKELEEILSSQTDLEVIFYKGYCILENGETWLSATILDHGPQAILIQLNENNGIEKIVQSHGFMNIEHPECRPFFTIGHHMYLVCAPGGGKKDVGDMIVNLETLDQIGLVDNIYDKKYNYAPAVTYLIEKRVVDGHPGHIINGSEIKNYRPDNPINRAEFTKIVVNATTEDTSTIQGSNCFPDVRDEWFASFVCTAQSNGTIGGYPDGTFKPADNVNFVEAAKIVADAFGLEVGEETGVWYENDVRALEAANAIPLSITSLDKKITRGEMAEMVYRIHANVRDLESRKYEDIAK